MAKSMTACCTKYLDKLDEVLLKKTGHKWKDMTFDNFVRYMYRPTDPASLGVSRMLFGVMMILDVPEERGGAEVDLRWGDPMGCHFPLIPMKAPTLPYMILIYALMWIGAFGIALGYKFRISTVMFAVPYWFIFLSEKSFWNNHSYLFGLVAILLIGTQANNYLCGFVASIDAHRSGEEKPVPYWNYFILKYQFFILYFVAGLKKSDKEWLSGYAMTNLSTHWVFSPFKLFLTEDQTDYLIVHWFAFVFDLTVCFWMMYEYTRPVAMVFCASFHLMNSRLFSIGMFPWVCLSTMPLFCPPDWPRLVLGWTRTNVGKWYTSRPKKGDESKPDKGQKENYGSGKCNDVDVNWKKKLVVYLLMTHMSLQAFLPYSHFITKGYNNWTNGLYGYSWDMMVNTWDTILILIKVVDNESKNEMFLDPDAWTPNDRWSRHGDMMYQYAHCLKRNLEMDLNKKTKSMYTGRKKDSKYDLVYDEFDDEPQERNDIRSANVSIYIDVWCSMNGRFQQRMFNPNYDLLKAKWSPFGKVEWLLPLLNEFNNRRETMAEIQDRVYSWNNYTEALFVADFPGLYLENYITPDLFNVTLTVLEGAAFYETLKKSKYNRMPEKSKAIRLGKGESAKVAPGAFHRVHTVGDVPSSYMYVYMNSTKKNMDEDPRRIWDQPEKKPMLPLHKEFRLRLRNAGTFLRHIGNALLNIIYGVPMVRRVEIR